MPERINNILTAIVPSDMQGYKCYNLLISLLQDEKFLLKIEEGLKNNLIRPIPTTIYEKLENMNLREGQIYDLLQSGYNIGRCTVMSKIFSYPLETSLICGGNLPILKGTQNCPEGKHTWISYGDYIIDTSLMLMIDKDYQEFLGYNETNRNNPMEDENYVAEKYFVNDKKINR